MNLKTLNIWTPWKMKQIIKKKFKEHKVDVVYMFVNEASKARKQGLNFLKY